MKCYYISTILVVLIIIFAHSNATANTIKYVRGEILKITNNEAHVLILQPPFQDEITIIQDYNRFELQGLNLTVNDQVILGIQIENGVITAAFIYDIVREQALFYLIGIFILLLLTIARLKGIKTLLTLVISGAIIMFFLLPSILKGMNAIVASTLAAGLIVVITLLIIGGLNTKTLAAIIGTITGVILAGVISIWIGAVGYITGFTNEEARLLILSAENLNIHSLLFGGIIIGSIGAVTDVAMSIASTAAEIKKINPLIERNQLIFSVMNVGKDIIGTMANTLILAYVGTGLPLLLLFTHHGFGSLLILNNELIVIEIIRGFAGSIGLLITAPVTAISASFFLTRKI